MIAPSVPPDEKQRIASLHKLNILDTPLEERFDRITRMVCTALGVPMSAFSLIDETRQWQKSNQELPGYVLPRNDSFCAHVVLEDEILNVPDTRNDVRFHDHPAVTDGLKVGFYAGAPVYSPDGYRVGSLCAIDTKPRDLTPDQLQVLRDLADMVEVELRADAMQQDNFRLLNELQATQRRSLIDPLTHIWNRAGLTEILKGEWAHAIRKNDTVVVAVIDLDHFKKVNDTYGHPAGDLVLQSLARRVTSVLRTGDTVGRMGGEEFLVVLPGCKGEEMLQVLERMRTLVAAVPVATDKGDISFTLSCGAVLVQPAKGVTAEDAISIADEAVYRAKQNGRNRVELGLAV